MNYSSFSPELQFEHWFLLVAAPLLILTERELALSVGFAVGVVLSALEIRESFLYCRQMANEKQFNLKLIISEGLMKSLRS